MCSREALNFVKFTIALKNIKIHGRLSVYMCMHNFYVPEKMQKVTIGTIKAVTRNTCYPSVYTFDGPLMLRVNWTIVDTIHLKGNKFAKSVKIKVNGDSKLNDSPAKCVSWAIDNRRKCCLGIMSHHNPVCIYLLPHSVENKTLSVMPKF